MSSCIKVWDMGISFSRGCRMSGCGYEAMGLHGGIERERMREMEG